MDPTYTMEGLRTIHVQGVLRKVISKNEDALVFRQIYTLGITIFASLAATLGAALGLRTSFRGVPLVAASIGLGILSAFICLAFLLPNKQEMMERKEEITKASKNLSHEEIISDERLKVVMTALRKDEKALQKLSRSMNAHQKEIAKTQFPHIQFK